MIITGFQLRASKAVLKMNYDTIHNDTQISKVTLGRILTSTKNSEEISCSAKDAYNLYKYFTDKGIRFPDKKSGSAIYFFNSKIQDQSPWLTATKEKNN